MIENRSYAHCEIKAWKKTGLNGIRTHELWDSGAVLYQKSYQANWELATLWIRDKKKIKARTLFEALISLELCI